MPELFELTQVDRKVYEERIRDFLPEKVIDAHTHVWLDAHSVHAPKEHERTVSWPSRVARDCSAEDLVESYRLMFPGKSVVPLIFSSVSESDDMDLKNDYVSTSAAKHRFPALIFAHPAWTGAELERKIRAGSFIGAKVYLNLSPAYLPRGEIRIFDFLPPHQLQFLHENCRVVMLHIPRDDRLRDPVNHAQMLEIEKNYPGIRLIIAHVGRAYCNEDVGSAFDVLKGTKNMVFDFAANTNAWVFEKAIRTFGPERCLFGSDLPITRMRMRRTCEGGRYLNVVPRGLYGDVSGDRNMREVDPPEADRLTFFMYEEILAIREACEKVGLDRKGVEAIFFGSARRVLGL